jgi:plasmid stabilization system protein ParE
MLRIEWTTPAADEFEHQQAYYQGIDPRIAQRLAQRVHQAARQLRTAPHSGRPGLRAGTREWVVVRTPYIVVYRVRSEAIEILHVFHERQDWTRAED